MQFTPEESPYPFIAMVPPARFGWLLTAPAAPVMTSAAGESLS